MGNGQSKSTSCYKKGKGCCLIINSKFAKSREKEGATAIGSNKNEDNIRKVFQSRDFEVTPLTDCTATEMMEAIQNLPSHYKSYFIFFLCPGYEDGVYDKNGVCLSFEDIHRAVNCRSFNDKPRILIFPTLTMREELRNKEIDADFLFAFNGQPHSPSHRDEERGSCYIEKLLSVIEERNSEDFESMLDSMGNQQDNMPSYLSSLKHKFYFVAAKRPKQRRSRQIVVGDVKQTEIQQDPVMPSQSLCKHNEDGTDLVPGVTRDSHNGFPKAAVTRSLSVESSSTNSTGSSQIVSINNEVSPAQSPLSFEGSPVQQSRQEAGPEERDEDHTLSIQAPVQAEENDEAKTSPPVSYSSNSSGENYLTIPETVEREDGVVTIVLSPKVVREEVLKDDDKMKRVEEWVNLTIYEKEDS